MRKNSNNSHNSPQDGHAIALAVRIEAHTFTDHTRAGLAATNTRASEALYAEDPWEDQCGRRIHWTWTLPVCARSRPWRGLARRARRVHARPLRSIQRAVALASARRASDHVRRTARASRRDGCVCGSGRGPVRRRGRHGSAVAPKTRPLGALYSIWFSDARAPPPGCYKCSSVT